MAKIRLFTYEDLEKCIILFMDVFAREPWNDQWSYEGTRDYLMDFIETPGFLGFIAENEDLIAGFALGHRKRWWEGDEFFISEMCVDTNVQRAGIGTEIFRFMERDLPERGINHIVLLTTRGFPSEKFYKKNGFREISRIMLLAKKIEE